MEHLMYATPEQFAAAGKATFDAFAGLAATQMATVERIANLSLRASKTAFEDGIGFSKSLFSAKDVQEFVNLNSAATQPAVEKALGFTREVYDLATQAQGEFAKVFEDQAAELNKTLTGMLDKFSKNAPASEVAVTAVKTAMAAANQAYDSFSKAAKQATEIAEANFTAASAVAKDSLKRKAA